MSLSFLIFFSPVRFGGWLAPNPPYPVCLSPPLNAPFRNCTCSIPRRIAASQCRTTHRSENEQRETAPINRRCVCSFATPRATSRRNVCSFSELMNCAVFGRIVNSGRFCVVPMPKFADCTLPDTKFHLYSQIPMSKFGCFALPDGEFGRVFDQIRRAGRFGGEP